MTVAATRSDLKLDSRTSKGASYRRESDENVWRVYRICRIAVVQPDEITCVAKRRKMTHEGTRCQPA
jgi:hypothetical protein